MTQDDLLRSFYERRHPLYVEKEPHWRFFQACYDGGRGWFTPDNIFRYLKEGDGEFNDRLKRAYRFNHTREIIELVQKYLFKGKIARADDAPAAVKAFWAKATLTGVDVTQLMRQAAAASSIGGRSAVVVDNNLKTATEAGRTLSIAEVESSGMRIYAYVVPAIDVLDYAWDEDGDGGLLWIKLREYTREDADPINDTGEIIERHRLWTRTGWKLFKKTIQVSSRKKDKIEKIEQLGAGEYDLGRVPVIFNDHTIGDGAYDVPGLVDDIAYLDRAVANYMSNLDAIIQDQTFSQLAIPAQALMPGDEPYNKMVELGTKRIFVYDAGSGSGARPEFMSPDPKQAGVILNTVNKLVNEIYHSVGLSGERTKTDNAVSLDNASGVAKAYDFEKTNSLLTSKAKACEATENGIVQLVCLWSGNAVPSKDLVKYPESFDVVRLIEELATAETLAKIPAPTEVRRQQMRNLVGKLFPQLDETTLKKLNDDIDEWLEGEELALAPPSSFAGGSKATPSRQGQVTATTGGSGRKAK